MFIGPFNTETSKKASAHKKGEGGKGKVKKREPTEEVTEKDNSLMKIYGNPSE